MRPILREGDPSIWGSTTLNDARSVRAIQWLNGGKQMITCEKYGVIFAALAIYDAATLERQQVWVFPEEIDPPHVLGIISDPQRILINFHYSLCCVNLETKTIEGTPVLLKFHTLPPKRWRVPFQEKHWFKVGNTGIYDGGELVVAHCGVSAPELPSNLISWQFPSFERIAGPVYTLKPTSASGTK